MTSPFGNLPLFGFDLIEADPPWRFKTRSQKGQAKGAAAHYETMSLEEIKALPVGRLARGDCLLLLWCPGWAMATGAATKVCEAWDFEPVTELVWQKLWPSGKPKMGTGYRARTLHEPVLLGKIGNPKHKPFPSHFAGVAREHSRKPEEFYRIVEAHTPRMIARLSLFSRENRPGWTGWGDESGKFNEGEAA